MSIQRIGNFLIRQCAFAHAEDELRDKHVLNHHYKTKVCTNFKQYGQCKYGERCQFLHLHEAPIVYSRTQETVQWVSSSLSEKYSESSEDFNGQRHQQNLSLLANFGLEMLDVYFGVKVGKKGGGANSGVTSWRREGSHRSFVSRSGGCRGWGVWIFRPSFRTTISVVSLVWGRCDGSCLPRK